MRKGLFISLGCDKNLADSEDMPGMLVEKSYEVTKEEKEAEGNVINTCGFIHDGRMTPDFKCPICGRGADQFVKMEDAPA